MPALAPPAGHARPALLWLLARFVADEDANAGQRLGDLLDAEDLHGAVDDGLGDVVVSDEFTATGQARARRELASFDALLEVVGDFFVSIARWHGVISSVGISE